MGSFHTILGPLIQNADTDVPENTYRQIIPTYALSGSVGGQMRITFAHDGANDYEIGEAWIGQQETEGGPDAWDFKDGLHENAQITWDSGSTSKVIDSDTIVSDTLNFNYDPTKVLVLSVYIKEEFPDVNVTVPSTTDASYEPLYGASQEEFPNVALEPDLDACDQTETGELHFVKKIESFTASAEDDVTASLEEQLFRLFIEASMSDDVNHCSLDATIPGLVLTTAYTNIAGNLDENLPLPTLEAHTGGVLDEELPTLTMEATAKSGNVASLDKRLPVPTCEAHAGSVLSENLPVLQVEASASVGHLATLDTNLPTPTLEASALVGTIGTLAKDLPALRLIASSSDRSGASLDASLPTLLLQAKATRGYLASLSENLPIVTLVALALQDETAQLDEDLPDLALLAHAITNARHDGVILQYQGR